MSFIGQFLKPMHSRDREEPHRVATSLELLFDLIFVVAIATAGVELHHAIVENHFWSAMPLYLMVFFALWWAWMNFTWFASAYDNDDALYRIMTMIQMLGALFIAAGIPDAFEHQNFDVIIVGYVIMRTVLIAQWLRASRHDPERKPTIFRYVIGISLVQLAWMFFHFAPIDFGIYIFLLLVIAELCIPYFAEKKGTTPWHPEHIAERYSLLTIIVFGESIVASFNAISDAFKTQVINTELIFLTIGGVIMMFTMWWAYFDRSMHDQLNSHSKTFIWGYGHFFIFISIAMLGAALSAAADVVTQHADVSNTYDGCIIAGLLIIYTCSLWMLQNREHLTGFGHWFYPISVLIIFVIPFVIPHIGYAVLLMAIVYALRLVLANWLMKSSN
ncbi:MAG: low temperature requirement protein A [Candidatus Acinetobacter avistercoris]|nr:low temperature requirement protein A [Candidatus Acinetobacter avistercoris]